MDASLLRAFNAATPGVMASMFEPELGMMDDAFVSSRRLIERVTVATPSRQHQIAVSMLNQKLPLLPYGGNMWLSSDVTMGVLLNATKLKQFISCMHVVDAWTDCRYDSTVHSCAASPACHRVKNSTCKPPSSEAPTPSHLVSVCPVHCADSSAECGTTKWCSDDEVHSAAAYQAKYGYEQYDIWGKDGAVIGDAIEQGGKGALNAAFHGCVFKPSQMDLYLKAAVEWRKRLPPRFHEDSIGEPNMTVYYRMTRDSYLKYHHHSGAAMTHSGGRIVARTQANCAALVRQSLHENENNASQLEYDFLSPTQKKSPEPLNRHSYDVARAIFPSVAKNVSFEAYHDPRREAEVVEAMLADGACTEYLGLPWVYKDQDYLETEVQLLMPNTSATADLFDSAVLGFVVTGMCGDLVPCTAEYLGDLLPRAAAAVRKFNAKRSTQPVGLYLGSRLSAAQLNGRWNASTGQSVPWARNGFKSDIESLLQPLPLDSEPDPYRGQFRSEPILEFGSGSGGSRRG